MYLPKSQFRVEDTYGEEFTDSSGNPYVGKVLRTASGRVYAGDSIVNNKGILSPVEKQDLNKIERPFNDYYGPKEADYVNGTFIKDWKWTAVKAIPLLEEETTKFPEGTTYKMDMKNAQHFSERDYIEALDYINMFEKE